MTPTTPEAGDATPDAATLTRHEAADALGVDERTVRRMASDGRLTPIAGPDGARRFRAEQVREVTIQRRVSNTVSLGEYQDGETAATLFGLFDDGVHPVDAVKRLRLPPRAVAALYGEWAELRGGMFVPEKELRQVSARFELSAPLRDAAHLFKELERVWPHRCSECQMDAPAVCLACAARIAVERARKRAADEQVKRELRRFEREIGELEGPFAHRRKRSAEASGRDGVAAEAARPNRG